MMNEFQLLGLRQRFEGLLHISQIRNDRVNAVADVLSRGQKVKTKVNYHFVFLLLLPYKCIKHLEILELY